MGKTVKLLFVVALVSFNDVLENVHRTKGDFFKCTQERYDEITSYNANLIKVVPDEKDIPDPTGYTPDANDSDVVDQNPETPVVADQDPEIPVADAQNPEGSTCDIAQLSDEELLKLAKEKKIRNASKMSREQLIEALQ